ncbi:MAG TPA: ATP-binding cassette domain-containing protein [Thermoanaerobaculia bacterium]|nr:ATP-binding cassette domain-containing protein [Thermoanaerobaculia bacterium]
MITAAPEATSICVGPATTLLVGRTPDNDLPIDHPLISRRHARFERSGARWTVTDLGSTNGTYVNGARITGPAALRIGDVVDFGGSRLVLVDEGRFERRDYRGNTRVEAQGVAVSVGKRRLLEGVSLTLLPSELVGLMGPSGAGKTTLMTALNGYQPPSAGRVLFNGRDLYDNFDYFRLGIGYVPQDDILHGELTVFEALYYTAKLRLPGDTTDEEIGQRIDRVLKQLRIAHIRESLIGSPAHKVVSGGERKRVNVAMELLTDPPVLFLDEPTSGLSSEDALMVMQVLRELAREGRTILLTIHQPSREVFRLMDNLAVVSRDVKSGDPARLVYYGPAYPEAIRFFNPGSELPAEPSPEGVLRGLAERPTAEWLKRFEASPLKHHFVDQRAGQAKILGTDEPGPRKAPSALKQTVILMRRGLVLKTRDLWNSSILMVQAPIIAFLLVLIFGTATKADADTRVLDEWLRGTTASVTVLFFMNIAAAWFGCSNAAREIVAEWAVFSRERIVGLRLTAYLASKLALLSVIGLVQCTLLLLIVRLGCRITAPWSWLLAGLFLSALAGSSLGLTLSSLAKSSEVAISLVPIVILPMVMLGGMLRPVHDMDQPARTLAHLMPSRWAFELAAIVEAETRPTAPLPQLPAPPGQAPSNAETRRDLAESYFPSHERTQKRTAFGVLAAQAFLFAAGTLAVLRSRDVHL